jgi:hypothetical protein
LEVRKEEKERVKEGAVASIGFAAPSFLLFYISLF